MNEEVLKRLDLLAAKLSTTGAHLWEVLVKQAYAEAADLFIWMIAALALTVVFIALSRRMFRRSNEVGENKGDHIFVGVVSALAAVLTSTLAVSSFASIIKTLMNPEYFALTKILEVLK
jgi:hypothetical protein